MNKYQESLERLAAINIIHLQGYERQKRVEESDQHNDIETMFELVIKTTPLKPLHKSVLKQFGRCEKCNAPIDIRNHMRFCGTCGQAIDWTNETE